MSEVVVARLPCRNLPLNGHLQGLLQGLIESLLQGRSLDRPPNTPEFEKPPAQCDVEPSRRGALALLKPLLSSIASNATSTDTQPDTCFVF